MPSIKPTASIHWDTGDKDVEVEGDLGKLGVGKKVHVTLSGVVSAYSHSEYGCSLQLHVTGLEVDKPTGHAPVGTGSVKEEEAEGEKAPVTMVAMIAGRQAKGARGGRR